MDAPPVFYSRNLAVCLGLLVPWLLLAVAIFVFCFGTLGDAWDEPCNWGTQLFLAALLVLLVLHLVAALPIAWWMRRYRADLRPDLYRAVARTWWLSVALLVSSAVGLAFLSSHQGSLPHTYNCHE